MKDAGSFSPENTMAKFNTAAVAPRRSIKVRNHAGGEAYSQAPKLELVSMLLTSFLNNSFYEKGSDTLKRLVALIEGGNSEFRQFAAKAALYARHEYGMRSITHVVAAEIARLEKGKQWTRPYLTNAVARADDITEILSYYLANYGKPIPNSMKVGLGAAMSNLDRYRLAKYKGGEGLTMVDAANLLHPPHTDALAELMKGTLKPAETWEVGLTQAGQEAETDEDKAVAKTVVWDRLISERKLGYFALLRNLRNLIEQASDEAYLAALAQLAEEKAIKKSMVLPFRYLTASAQIRTIPGKRAVEALRAINKAVDVAVGNLPDLPGRTLVALDVSGSMTWGGQTVPPCEIGGLFTAAIGRNENADVLTFDNTAAWVTFDPDSSVVSNTKAIPFRGGGTDFRCIFNSLKEKYDRIFILSDMQAWIGYNTPTKEYAAYKARTQCEPWLYCWDLNGHGTTQFHENQVVSLAGFSEKVFDLISVVEQDRNALISVIDAVPMS